MGRLWVHLHACCSLVSPVACSSCSWSSKGLTPSLPPSLLPYVTCVCYFPLPPTASAPAAPAFGAAAPSPFGGGFGSTTPAGTPAFGGFGASAASTGGGLFGAASTPAAGSTFSFGGASTGSAFGASSTPAFGGECWCVDSPLFFLCGAVRSSV